jgi:tetratricopeptide (TPR) repeat protein
MTLTGPSYALPRSPEEFARLCLRLLRRHWQLGQLERLRDPENRALGVDLLEVSGRPLLSAVRCDLREMHEPPSIGWIKDAVELAASLSLPIGRFVVATTAWRSKALRRAVIEVNRANRAANLFAVEVLCWEDIEELLDEYPDPLTEFESTPKRQALTKPDALCQLEPLWPALKPTAEAGDRADDEIVAAAALIGRRNYQMARLKLLQVREQRWGELNTDQRLGLLITLAFVWLKEGELRRAAMLFIAGRSLAPDDETSCANEILAYELLGEYQRACALAETMTARFPASGRAWALWLNNTPRSSTTAELKSRIPAEVCDHPEVALVMATRATADGEYATGEHFGRKAAQALAEKSDPWLVLGRAILLAEIGSPSAAAERNRVREAEECFGRAVSLAASEGRVGNEVQALIGRAQARIALRDIEGAGADIEQAHALEREDANGLCEYGILLRSRGELDEAVEIFRRAARTGGRDDADYQLAVTLRERGLASDLQEAASRLVAAVSNPQTIPGGDYLFAVGCAVDALSRLERWHEAESLLDGLDPGLIVGSTMLTLRGALELSRANLAEASRFADRALEEIGPESSADERRALGALLHDLGRYAEALGLWQSLAHPGCPPGDIRRLLECAGRLGRDEIALDICRRLRAAGELKDGAIEFELEILERNDPQAALDLLDSQLKAHPDDRVMRLRRSALARKVGRKDLVDDQAKAMPPAAEVLPALGRVAVELMRETGHPNEALAYAHELLRRNPTDADAHRAFLYALGPIGPMPVVPEFERAEPGCAVCLVEQDGAAERWVVLEDAPDPDESLDEYGPTHPVAKQLRGRRPGDKVQLPEPEFSRKTMVVRWIISKYAHRYQDCLAGWQARFPGLPEIEMAPSGRQTEARQGKEEPAALDGAFAAGLSCEDAFAKTEQLYASNSLSMHALAQRAGLSDVHAMFLLAARPGAIIKCCEGSEDELNAALVAYDRANSIVLDLSAIATLCLLGRVNLLASWPRKFVIAQAAVHELRRLQFGELQMRLPTGFSASLSGADALGQKPEAQMRALADELAPLCAVGDAAVLSTLAPARRERLMCLFGRHGAESVALAAMPGHALWSDDRVMANLARHEFGVRRIWTQSALMARAQSGNLDPAELATATTKLAGWGYSFTTPSVETLMGAGAVADWNPNQFPLKQALDQFATESVKLSDAIILAAELIVKMYSDIYLRSMRTTVTMRLLDRIVERPGGRDAIEAMPRSLPIRLGLDIIGGRELADTIRGWMAEHSEEIAA